MHRALISVLAALVLASSSNAHPGHSHPKRALKFVKRQDPDAPFSAAKFPDIQRIMEGNQRFQDTRDAEAIQSLVDDGQKPPFMMITCSDSRVAEASTFDTDPGTFFMARNIGNQYVPGDSAESALAFSLNILNVQHVIVLGHFSCGAPSAVIASQPKNNIDFATHSIFTWIADIRQLYLSSNRSEIVEMRERNFAIEAEGGTIEPPATQEPGYRALVEENIKMQVKRVSESTLISNFHDRLAAQDGAGPLRPVFVHGFVHDLETGEVIDLGISTGPPGFEDFVPEEGSEESTGDESEESDESSEPAPEETVSRDAQTPIDDEANKNLEEDEEDEVRGDQASESGSRNSDMKIIGEHSIPARRLARRQLGRPTWSFRK